MLILAIETSCDETAAAVIKDGVEILSNVINSQVDIHQKFGGVVPEVASRHHIENIKSVVSKALAEANIKLSDIDAIAVTNTPGLVGALLVGVSYAKGLAFGLGVPLIPVNHIHAHICALFLAHPKLKPPFLCLVASGGHSHIIYVKGFTDFEVIARTRDDAAGEAYDKIARILGLGYPGGPVVSKYAENGDENFLKLPRVKMADSFDYSFSGVKTSVINYVHTCRQKGEELRAADICASFQRAVNEALCQHLIDAAKEIKVDTIALAGGVAANQKLRELAEKFAYDNNMKFYCPYLELCTDNAAMVGCSGYFNMQAGITADMSLNAIATI
ncbi:MAG: tRNA (adenosine(37)-N6)-threonylcarbamoyltransferase complex transferase subunit TsaD [Oscillospiraceae bacterium]|nr:tRNA (adenosine(37)-N6)-threonylcarbamoyltransferase complex transferase subunit TsaD [Oscillospiraceae bacterium]